MKPKLFIINGPLGAGKTTFLRSSLQLAQFKHARVIENEFASASIDTDQLHSHQGEVRTISGICICCSTGDELTEALASLASSPDPVIIEATGVANSLQLIEKLALADMFGRYDLAHAFFVLDGAETVDRVNATLTSYGPEMLAADTVIITKTDLMTPDDISLLIRRLADTGIDRIGIAHEGVVAADTFERPSTMLAFFANANDTPLQVAQAHSYTIIPMTDMPMDEAGVSALWDDLRTSYQLLRLKGDVVDGRGSSWHVEATPSQCRVTSNAVARTPQLVMIGQDAHLITPTILKRQWCKP